MYAVNMFSLSGNQLIRTNLQEFTHHFYVFKNVSLHVQFSYFAKQHKNTNNFECVYLISKFMRNLN
jgi:hypothetical protein